MSRLDEAPIGSLWVHLKTRRVYRIQGHCMLESTWSFGVLYHAEGGVGQLDIVRDLEEFLDGRFQELTD